MTATVEGVRGDKSVVVVNSKDVLARAREH